MGDRYDIDVECKCGEKDTAWYAPTCGCMTWKCPKCGNVINLEEYSGIDAISCANTQCGVVSVENLKRELNTPSKKKES